MKYCINYQPSKNLALDILKLCVTNNKGVVLLVTSHALSEKYYEFFKFLAKSTPSSHLIFGLENKISNENILSACKKIRSTYPDMLIGIIHFSAGGALAKDQVELRKNIKICVNGSYQTIADFAIIGFTLGNFYNRYLLENEKRINIFDTCKYVFDAITYCGNLYNIIKDSSTNKQ